MFSIASNAGSTDIFSASFTILNGFELFDGENSADGEWLPSGFTDIAIDAKHSTIIANTKIVLIFNSCLLKAIIKNSQIGCMFQPPRHIFKSLIFLVSLPEFIHKDLSGTRKRSYQECSIQSIGVTVKDEDAAVILITV